TRMTPAQLELTTARPAGITKIPSGIKAPYFTTIRLGPRERPSTFNVLVDAPEGKPSRIFVDANGNGNFLDDPPALWTHKEYAGRANDHLIMSVGSATVQVR